MWSFCLCPRGSVRNDALAYLGRAFLPLSLLDQRPAAQDHAMGRQEGKLLLAREGKGCLCPLLGRLRLSAELMERGSPAENQGQTVGVRQARGQSECSLTALPGLVRVPKMPQDTRQKA